MSDDTVGSSTGSHRAACDRCGRLAEPLVFDDISQKDVCPACLSHLHGRRLRRH